MIWDVSACHQEGASKGGETPGVSKPAAPKRVSTAADLERAEQLKLEGEYWYQQRS